MTEDFIKRYAFDVTDADRPSVSRVNAALERLRTIWTIIAHVSYLWQNDRHHEAVTIANLIGFQILSVSRSDDEDGAIYSEKRTKGRIRRISHTLEYGCQMLTIIRQWEAFLEKNQDDSVVHALGWDADCLVEAILALDNERVIEAWKTIREGREMRDVPHTVMTFFQGTEGTGTLTSTAEAT